jgi:hypothetical protein
VDRAAINSAISYDPISQGTWQGVRKPAGENLTKLSKTSRKNAIGAEAAPIGIRLVIAN